MYKGEGKRDPQRIEQESVKAGAAQVDHLSGIAVFRQNNTAKTPAELALRSSGDQVLPAEPDAVICELQFADVGGLRQLGDCMVRVPDSRVVAITVDKILLVTQRAEQINPRAEPP